LVEVRMAESLHDTATCCIVGGGPAGVVLGFLLARAGVDVIVLEKHADFFRDFRGDTIHPSTFELMYELGLLDEFLRVPHQEFRQIGGQIGDFEVMIADFSHLPVHCKFVGVMPQWDFLNFMAAHAKRYPGFRLLMETEATDLLEENGCILGVRAKSPRGSVEVRAKLTVGADGRHSIIRQKAGFEVIDRGAPIDVLWMKLSRDPTDTDQTLGRYREGKLLVSLNRGDYWQCAYVIRKGEFDSIRERGLEAFRRDIVTVVPMFGDRVGELKDWDQVKLLSVAVDHLKHWSRPGLVCIGDSAHAMSPIGGVGINLAIQDAVAAANILAAPLQKGLPVNALLPKVQQRREFPTQVIQRFQVFAHKNFINQALQQTAPLKRLPFMLRLLQRFPVLQRIPARAIGLGPRPEHVRSPVV
jgi:2-polyprenyl-6-methoxyphenol hydroxylase-like FAD-dependent oxidoreductase